MAPYVAHFGHGGIHCVGIGGAASIENGLQARFRVEQLSAAGLIEAVGAIPMHVRVYAWLKAQLPRVDGVFVVDSPELGIRLGRQARRLGIPVAYLSPPQAWAWRPWRSRALTEMAWVGCLFEFESRWYRQRGVSAVHVGHPLAGGPRLPPGDPQEIALLPGSRSAYVERLLPIMLQAASRLGAADARLRFHLGLAHAGLGPLVREMVDQCPIRVTIHRGAEGALAASGLAVTGCGTATLQGVLRGRPTIALGQAHPLSAFLARRLVTTRFFSLPNLIAGRRLFPELIQADCTPLGLAHELNALFLRFEAACDDCELVRDAVQVMDREVPDDALNALSSKFRH